MTAEFEVEMRHAGHRTESSRQNALMTGRVQGRQLKDQIPFGVGYRAGCQYNDPMSITPQYLQKLLDEREAPSYPVIRRINL
jgi:hypothetical protein